MAEENWRVEAACVDVNPLVFFPGPDDSTALPKMICSQCTVREQCLRYALEHHERFGIWGGLTERERRHARRAFVMARKQSQNLNGAA